MATENIVVNVVSNAEPLKPTIDLLVKMGQIAAKDAEEFKKLIDQSTKLGTESKKAATEAIALADALPGGKRNPKPSQETQKTTEAFKSLKTQLSEAKTEAARLAQEMGQFSPQAIEAAKKAALLDDRMKDLNRTLQALNPEQKLGAFIQLGVGISGAFTAAQGAMALFGNESEDVQKALLKVQGALALTQGLQSVLGLKDAFRDLRIVLGITSAAQTAVNASQVAGAASANIFTAATARLNAVMLANPVGIVVAALAALLALYYTLTRASERATAAQEAYNKALEENVKFDEAITEAQNKRRDSNAVIRDLQRQIDLLTSTEAKTSEIIQLKLKQNEVDLVYGRVLRDNLKGTDAYNKATQNVLDLINKRLILQHQLNDALREERSENIIPTDSINGIQRMIDEIKEGQKAINELPETLKKVGDGFSTVSKEGQLAFKNIFGQEVAFTKEGLAALEEFAEQGKEIIIDLLDTFGDGFRANADELNALKDERLAAFDEEGDRLKELNDNKILSDGAYAQKQKELAKQREATEKELNKKIAEEKRKAFIADRIATLVKISIQTAENAVKLFGQTIPPGILSALAIAFGAIQASLVLSQPVPKFKKGVIGLDGQGTGTSDSIPAMLSKGESVMTAGETRRFEPTLLAIRKNIISPEILNSFAVNHRFGKVEAFMDAGKLTRANRKIVPYQANEIGKSVAHYMNELNYHSPLRQ